MHSIMFLCSFFFSVSSAILGLANLLFQLHHNILHDLSSVCIYNCTPHLLILTSLLQPLIILWTLSASVCQTYFFLVFDPFDSERAVTTLYNYAPFHNLICLFIRLFFNVLLRVTVEEILWKLLIFITPLFSSYVICQWPNNEKTMLAWLLYYQHLFSHRALPMNAIVFVCTFNILRLYENLTYIIYKLPFCFVFIIFQLVSLFSWTMQTTVWFLECVGAFFYSFCLHFYRSLGSAKLDKSLWLMLKLILLSYA